MAVVTILVITFFTFFIVNSNRKNNEQWKNSLTIPANWEFISESEGGGDLIDSPQKTITRTYKTPSNVATALQELESSLETAGYSNLAVDLAGCESPNPTPSCYISGDNDAISVRASKSVEDPNTIVVVITKK